MPQAVPTGLNPKDVAIAHALTRMFPGVAVGGSYLVMPDRAKDIDIFMTGENWHNNVEPFLRENGVFYRSTWQESDEYQSDAGYALLDVISCGDINIIIVKPQFVDAYYKAAEIMKSSPQDYQDKNVRILLHRKLRGEARDGL